MSCCAATAFATLKFCRAFKYKDCTQPSHLEGRAVYSSKHVMLCSQRHISGHMHQFSRSYKCTRGLRCFAMLRFVCAGGNSSLLLLWVLVCAVGNKVDNSSGLVIICVIISLQGYQM